MAEAIDRFTLSNDFDDIETIVRAAGGYVRASDDLRPRVLDNVRMERREWRVQRGVRKAAVFFIFAGVLTAFLRASYPTSGLDQMGWLAASSNQLLMPAQVTSGGDAGWQLVDSFSELRRRQAMVLGNSP